MINNYRDIIEVYIPDNIYGERGVVNFVADHTEGVAAISLPPQHVDIVGVALGERDTLIVARCNSSSYCEVLALECAMAVENGADEVEIAVNVGDLREGNHDKIASMISMIKEEIEDDALLIIDLSADQLVGDLLKCSVEIAVNSGADGVIISGDRLKDIDLGVVASNELIVKVKGGSFDEAIVKSDLAKFRIIEAAV